MLAVMELTGAERAVAWIGLLVALGVLAVSLDMLSGGRVFGWSGPTVWAEAADDS